MSAPDRHPWFASARRGVRLLALVGLAVVVGCKSKDAGGGGLAKSDPLFGGSGRIPRQNVPVPDRGGTANGSVRGDPLLGSPTGRTSSNTGTGYSDDPSRWNQGPYIPGKGGTPAALAGRPRTGGEGLRIEAPGGVPLTPVGGFAPVTPQPTPAADTRLGELAAFGVRRGDYRLTRENGQHVFRVSVPKPGGDGVRGYEGRGPTEAAAVAQALEQIKADRR